MIGKKMKVKMVDKLESEGKTYNLYVKGHLLMNLTLESGHELNAEIALDIVKDIAKQERVNPNKVKPEDVTFEEAEPEFDWEVNKNGYTK